MVQTMRGVWLAGRGTAPGIRPAAVLTALSRPVPGTMTRRAGCILQAREHKYRGLVVTSELGLQQRGRQGRQGPCMLI